MVGARWSCGNTLGQRLAGLPSPATLNDDDSTFDGSRGVANGCCPPMCSVTVTGFITQAGGTQLPFGSVSVGAPFGCACRTA